MHLAYLIITRLLINLVFLLLLNIFEIAYDFL